MSKAIGLLVDGEVTWHARGVASDYDTLCGLDADDPRLGHRGLVLPNPGTKIDCETCRSVYQRFKALKLKKSNFRE